LRATLSAALLLAFGLAPAAWALEVSMARARLAPGDRQEVSVSGLEPGEGFRAAWLDPTGRVRGSWNLRAGRGGVGRVRFRTTGALSGTHRLLVRRTPDSALRPSSVSIMGAGASFEILPGEAPSYLTVLDAPGLPRDKAEELARLLGARAVASPGGAPPPAPLAWMVRALEGGPAFLDLEEADLRARRTAYARSPADALLARPVCLRDRAWLVHVWKWAGPRAEAAARARPWLWELGRDVRLADKEGGLDFCRSSHCARAFLSELRLNHEDIASLNRRWGSTFRRWADVRPPTTRELVGEIRSPETGMTRAGSALAAWSDHRDFLDRTWTRALRESRELLRSVTRRGPVGLGGVDLPGVFTGADPVRLPREIDWLDIAPRPLDLALARCFTPRRCRVLTRLGQRDPAGVLLGGLASGHRGVVVLPGDARPADDAWPGLKSVLGKIEAGLGELFRLSIWEPDPVVVLYSRESVRVEWAIRAARGAPARPAAALAAWAHLLGDVGLAARFVETGELRSVLRGGRVRALVLPRAYVLGGADLAEIDRFVAGGGLAVADASAGVFDEEFRPGPRPRIESVFGISREPGSSLLTEGPDGKTVFAGLDLPGAYIDGVDGSAIDLAEPDVGATAAYAHARSGGAVGLLSNPYARGRGVYLNVGLEGYPEERLSPRGASMRRLVRNVLELARVTPRVGVVAGGADLDGCERVVRRIEEMEIVTLRRDPAFGKERVAAELVFDRPALCFDVLTGVLIGRDTRVRVKLGAGPRVFARLPYDVEGITLKVSEQGDVVRYRGIVETPEDLAGTHVIRREILDAGGRAVPGGAATIVADRGVFGGSVTFAGNEPGGDYRLVFRDVASGVEAEIALTREPPPLAAEFPLPDAERQAEPLMDANAR